MPDPTPTPAFPSPEVNAKELESGKAMAILSYLPISPVNLIVSIICVVTKNNAYSLYHGKQALTLIILTAIAAVICIPLMCIGIGIIAYPVVIIGFFVLSILGIVNAAGGKTKPLPLTGKFADKWFGGIRKV